MDSAIPGIYFVWAQDRAIARTIRLLQPLTIGRDLFGDPKISTNHLRVEAREGLFFLEDLGSRNGSFYNNERINQPRVPAGGFVYGHFPGGVGEGWLRVGDTVGRLYNDIRPFEGEGDELALRHGCFVGRTMTGVHDELDDAAAASAHLHLIGDPGSGRAQLGRSYAARLAPLRVLIEDEPIGGDRERERALCDAAASAFDVRLVILRNRIAHVDAPILGELLGHQARRIEVPPIEHRADEVAAIIAQALRGVTSVTSPSRLFLRCLRMLPAVSLQTLVQRLPELAREPSPR